MSVVGSDPGSDTPPLDVLVVGAGPTGLALAAQLHAFGARFRLVDRLLDRVHESRALAIQPRTLGFSPASGFPTSWSPTATRRYGCGCT